MTGRLRGLRGLRGLNGQPRHGRRGGEKITYSLEQTERYKSPVERLRKAQQDILPNWDALVTEENVSSSVTLYRISSDRSPFGYWTVAVLRDPSDPTLPPPDLPELPPGEVPGGGDPLPSVYAVHTNNLGISSPGLPPGLEIAIGSRTVNALPPFPYPTGESYPGGVVVVAPGVPTIVSPNDLSGLTLAQARTAEETVWFRHSKLYQLAGLPFTVWLIRRYSGPGPNPPIYDDLNNFGYNNPFDEFDPLVDFGGGIPTPIGQGDPIGGGSSGGGGGDPLQQDPTPPPRYPPIPNEPSEPPGEFSCDCPDWTRLEYVDAESPYPSRWRDREWVQSAAGSEGDCKHIMAVKLHLGLPV